jgi:hypothetical protein
MAAQLSTAQSNVAVLKELYSDDAWVTKNYLYNNNPGLALMPKEEAQNGSLMGGKYFPVPAIVFGPAGGGSASFSAAQSNQTAPVTQEFLVTRVNNYQLFSISGDFLRASDSEMAAFMPAQELNVSTAFTMLGNDLALMLYGNGSGTRGTYGLGSGSIASGVITLDYAQTAQFFAIGHSLVSFSISGSTPTQSTGAAPGYVIGVNVPAGQITVSASQGGAAGNPSGWSTSFPYLARSGDVNFVSGGLLSSNMLKMAGLSGWITTPASSGDSWFGVNRYQAPQQLAGLVFNGTNESIQDALIDAANQLDALRTECGSADVIIMNPVSYQTLLKQMTVQIVYQMMDVKISEDTSISFKSIVLPTGFGSINVVQDRNCPPQTAFILNTKTWKLKTIGKLVDFLTYKGLYDEIGFPLVGNGIDGIQMQLISVNNLVCNAPVANCLVQLAQ